MKKTMGTKAKAVRSRKGFGTLDREKARKESQRALKILRTVSTGVASDSSIHECYSNCLEHELESIARTLLRDIFPERPEAQASLDCLFE
jgi:hypothetical protein